MGVYRFANGLDKEQGGGISSFTRHLKLAPKIMLVQERKMLITFFFLYNVTYYFKDNLKPHLTLSQVTNFRLLQTRRVCRQQ